MDCAIRLLYSRRNHDGVANDASLPWCAYSMWSHRVRADLMVKIANEIAQTVASHAIVSGNAYAFAIEPIIATMLEPIRELLERIKSDVVCEGVSLKLVHDEHSEECSPKMALSSIGEKAIAALSLFEEV